MVNDGGGAGGDDGQLDGKVAVVTGAGSGIGAAMAAGLHEAGARMVAADVSGRQEETAERLGAGAHPVQVDVSRAAEVQAMFQAALDEFGRLDVVCNNAGIEGELAPLAELGGQLRPDHGRQRPRGVPEHAPRAAHPHHRWSTGCRAR